MTDTATHDTDAPLYDDETTALINDAAAEAIAQMVDALDDDGALVLQAAASVALCVSRAYGAPLDHFIAALRALDADNPDVPDTLN